MRYLSTIIKFLVLGLLILLLVFQHRWEPLLNVFSIPLQQRLENFLGALLHFSIFILVLNLGIHLLISVYRSSKKMRPNQVDNVVLGLQNAYYIVFFLAVTLTIAASFGYAPAELFTSLSIVAAAIAIISKDFISEIISGMIIAFSKEVAIDDYVKIGDHKGRIIDITLTKIALLNEDDDIIFLPNNKVYTSEIVNYTRKEIKKVSIEFELNIQALETVEELEAHLTEAISDYREHIERNSYNLKVVEIRKDSLAFKFQYILHQINRELEREIRRKTVRRITNFVKQNLSDAGKEEVLK